MCVQKHECYTLYPTGSVCLAFVIDELERFLHADCRLTYIT